MKNSNNITIKKFIKNPILWLACGLGSGLIPKISGTTGSLLALIIYIFILQKFNYYFLIAFVIITSIIGIFICDIASNKFFNQQDHKSIVWDEFAGMWIACLYLPQDNINILWYIITFIVFRYFDIIKPWPIKQLDKKITGGIGIMLDDIIAGIFSLLIMATIFKLL